VSKPMLDSVAIPAALFVEQCARHAAKAMHLSCRRSCSRGGYTPPVLGCQETARDVLDTEIR
jgi:hypothetical protein